MAEYIDKDALLDDIAAAVENGGLGAVVAGTMKRYIMRVPAADVAPVVHGRWEVDEFGRCCSACKEYIPDDFAPSEHCPNCGAKMDLED